MVTTVLELVGLVAVSVALGLFVALFPVTGVWSVSAGLAVFGLCLIGVSFLVTRVRRSR